MLAELHGKLDPQGSAGVDRSEDLLTDAVFGAIRYLPRTAALGRVLESIGVRASSPELAHAEIRLWPQIPMPRWPGTVIEPDVVVVVGKQVVVFEAKLHSPFGRYPDPDGGADLHQLAVQYAAVASWAAGERLLPPVVVAVTAPTVRPDQDLEQATADVQRLLGNAAAPRFASLRWRDIGALLEETPRLEVHERQLVHDLLALMEKRGVRRMFEGFRSEDYWLVAAAQRVAADRLYPQIQTFIDDLTAVLDDDGIGWSQPSYRGMWLGLGTSVSKPTDWTRSFVGAQFWPRDWPNRTGKLGANLALYVLFDFLDPALEVGLSIPGPGVAQAQQTWSAHFATLVEELVSAAEGLRLVLDSGDVARPTRSTPVDAVDVSWLEAAASAAGGAAHLRLCTRRDPLTLTVQEAREAITAIRAAVEQCPALWDLLGSSGHVSTSAQDPLER